MAFEQVGLKLESRKVPVSVIMIDHAEPPTINYFPAQNSLIN
jgi:uncharacterized protein (TIGR03435 family)